MPPSKSSKWFITLSTRSEQDVDEILVQTTVQGYKQYYVVKEYGQKHDHPHYHICLWGDKEERQDVVRRRWITLLSLEAQTNAVTVKPITNDQQLIGKYLNKDEYAEVLISNIPDSEVTRMKEMYDKVNKVKPLKYKHLCISDVADAIVSYSKAHSLPLQTRQHVSDVIYYMYQEGIRFNSTLRCPNVIWKEICLIVSDRPLDEREIFIG